MPSPMHTRYWKGMVVAAILALVVIAVAHLAGWV